MIFFGAYLSPAMLSLGEEYLKRSGQDKFFGIIPGQQVLIAGMLVLVVRYLMANFTGVGIAWLVSSAVRIAMDLALNYYAVKALRGLLRGSRYAWLA